MTPKSTKSDMIGPRPLKIEELNGRILDKNSDIHINVNSLKDTKITVIEYVWTKLPYHRYT